MTWFSFSAHYYQSNISHAIMHVWISGDLFDLPAVSSARPAGQMAVTAGWCYRWMMSSSSRETKKKKRTTKEKPTRSDACGNDKRRNKRSRGSFFVHKYAKPGGLDETQHIWQSTLLTLWQLRINKHGTATSESPETMHMGATASDSLTKTGARASCSPQGHLALVRLRRWDQATKKTGTLKLQYSVIK